MKQKIFLIIIVMLFLVQWTCTTGEKPPFSKNLWAPFYWQEQSNWCGPACVQMWTDKCGIYVEQLEIAAFCGVPTPSTGLVPPHILRDAVGYFTTVNGYFASRSWFSILGRDELIASCIASVDNGQPSIMPFWGDHAVLIKGFDWEEDPYDGKPVALGCMFHDPNGLPNDYISARRLDQYFDTGGSDFWVILAYSWLEWRGIEAFGDFIAAGGTYYGGPDVYDPSDLDPEQ